MYEIKDWSVVPFYKSESDKIEYRLHGKVYNHPTFPDGTCIITSTIRGVSCFDTYKIVRTENSEYVIMPCEINEHFAKLESY